MDVLQLESDPVHVPISVLHTKAQFIQDRNYCSSKRYIYKRKKKIKFQLFFSIDLSSKFWKKLFTVCVSSALTWESHMNSGLISGFSQIHPLLENNQKKSTVCVFENSFWVIMEPPDIGHKSVRRRIRCLFLGYQEQETPHGPWSSLLRHSSNLAQWLLTVFSP